MKKEKKSPVKRIWRMMQRNDVVLRIYTSFAFILVLTGILTGMIFNQLYRTNYIRSYTKLLTRQGKIIAKKVSNFNEKKKETQFQRYNKYIDEIGQKIPMSGSWQTAMQRIRYRKSLLMHRQMNRSFQKILSLSYKKDTRAKSHLIPVMMMSME